MNSLFIIFFGLVAMMIFGVAVLVVIGFIRHQKLGHTIHKHIDRALEGEGNDEAKPATKTTCSKCGAGLTADTEISPSGDFKCTYCNTWSNVHH